MDDTGYGDRVEGDKIGGDQIFGNKYVTYHAAAENASGPSLEQALAVLAELPTESVPEPGPLPPNSRMPFGVNPKFTGRVGDFKKLAETLKGQDPDNGPARAAAINQAITGLGGVGKTQLAAEFAHRYGRYFLGGVYWLSFADPNAVPAEIAACGRRMGLDSPNRQNVPPAERLAPSLSRYVEATIAEWEKAMPRLLIFDNCEHEALFEEYRPKSGGARVLVTSRRGRWSPGLGLAALPLGLLAREESVRLLQAFWRPLTDEEAGAIAEALGHLPLALHLAGSYLNYYEGAVEAAQFLDELKRAGPFHEALAGKIEGHTPTRHERNVARTFEMSYVQLDERDLAHRILLHLAHLAPGEPVPDSLLKATFGREEERPDDKAFVDARQRLVRLGLVTVDGGSIRLHRLAGVYVKRVVDEFSLLKTLVIVERGANYLALEINKSGLPARLLGWQNHLRHLTDKALERETEFGATLATNLAYHLVMTADYKGARPYYEQALAIRERVLGPDHADTAQSLNNMGTVLQALNDPAGARPYFERALSIRERVLGPDHTETAQSLNNLGKVMNDLGHLEAAKRYYSQALEIYEQWHGPDHPSVATGLNNLAGLLSEMGDEEGALRHYKRALEINEKVQGPKHPDTALSLTNLGVLLYRMGKREEARPYFERALAIREESLGPNHPDTANSLHNIGVLLAETGDLPGARPYYQRALAIRERALGPHHPDTIKTLLSLGLLLKDLEELDKARDYLEQALAILEVQLGKEHAITNFVRDNLAEVGED